MLSERQLAALPLSIQDNFRRLESDIIQRMCGHIAEIGQLTATDAHRLAELQRIGYEVEAIERQIAATAQMSQRQIREVLRQAAEMEYNGQRATWDFTNTPWVPFDENQNLQNLIDSISRATAQRMVNMSQTTGFINARNAFGVKLPNGRYQPLAEYYQSVVDYATLQIRTGQTDFNSAMRATINAMADRGFTTVDYESGYTRRMDTAVRANLMDAQAQLSMAQAEMIGQMTGADGMEISWHSGARDSHVWIGGIQVSLDEYYRDVKPVMDEHNCYHRAWSIRMGQSIPAHSKAELAALNAKDAELREYKGREYNAYGAQKKQREFETTIRQYKDRVVAFRASGDTEAARIARARVRSTQAEYTRFSAAMNTPVKPGRTRVAGYR